MDKVNYRYFYGGEWFEVKLPVSDGEGLIIPNVSAIVYRDETKREILLQRRDKPGEAIRGKLEIPSGRWRAGEKPQDALIREVGEETGLRLANIEVGSSELGDPPALYVASHPLFVVSGFGGGYPALLVVYECVAENDEPRARSGETCGPDWFFIDDIRKMLTEDPGGFTPPAYAVLSHYVKLFTSEESD